jgi:hypothetical protein|tara:strand:+ start:125 stop:346 length:222 start_codon:yes stop_codon:yes gene_type:complete
MISGEQERKIIEETKTLNDKIKFIETRVKRLESFILKNMDYPGMLDDSDLQSTILDEVAHNFYVSTNSELKRN